MNNIVSCMSFHAGIPGCAKSVLCRELLNVPSAFGDDRDVQSLMGDLTKGINSNYLLHSVAQNFRNVQFVLSFSSCHLLFAA